jgi:Fur family transcriptional regulator, peroxide stress response regulator
MSTTHQEFRDLCSAHGLSVTHQRQVIYEALRSFKEHPSPEAIYERVREQIPSISLGTVYKNIKTFVESGIVKEVSLHHGSTRIETNMEPHHHLVCLKCKAIVDLEDDALEPVRARKRLPKGFRIHRYSVEVIGLCQECAD